MVKISVIANPTAGYRRRPWRDDVRSTLSVLGPVEILTTDSPEGTTEAARECEARGVELIVAAGGDGTVHRVINGVMSPRTAVGILPVGTGNDLANHIGIPPAAADAAAAIVRGGERMIDTVRIVATSSRAKSTPRQVGIRIHTVAGFLVLADAALRAERIKRRWPWLGPSVYRIAAAISIVLHGGETAVGSLISNQPTMGGNLKLPCDSVVDDGRFEVVTLTGGGRIKLARTLAAMSAGRPLPEGAMTWTSAAETTLEFDDDVEWFGDGEGLGRARRFEIAVEPKSLRIRGVV